MDWLRLKVLIIYHRWFQHRHEPLRGDSHQRPKYQDPLASIRCNSGEPSSLHAVVGVLGSVAFEVLSCQILN